MCSKIKLVFNASQSFCLKITFVINYCFSIFFSNLLFLKNILKIINLLVQKGGGNRLYLLPLDVPMRLVLYTLIQYKISNLIHKYLNFGHNFLEYEIEEDSVAADRVGNNVLQYR